MAEIVWDTLKAVLRGSIISYCVNKKKERHERLTKLTNRMVELETEHKTDLNSKVAVRLKEMWKETNNLYTQETQKDDLHKTKIL